MSRGHRGRHPESDSAAHVCPLTVAMLPQMIEVEQPILREIPVILVINNQMDSDMRGESTLPISNDIEQVANGDLKKRVVLLEDNDTQYAMSSRCWMVGLNTVA